MVNTPYTLNRFITALTGFAQNHSQINSFGFGDGFDIGSRDCLYNENLTVGKITYGAMWCIPQPSVTTRRLLQHRFSILFMDRVNTEQDNLNDVLSDQLEILRDFCAWMVNEFSHIDDFNIDNNYSFPIMPFTEFTDDAVAGYKLDVTVQFINLNDYCAVPQKD